MEGKYQNEIPTLPLLDLTRYENIFKIYNVEDTPNNFQFYNITRAVKISTDNIDSTYINVFNVDRPISWTNLSYMLYGTMFLWWLIRVLNPEKGNLFSVKPGSAITVIKPAYVNMVLESISAQIKQ